MSVAERANELMVDRLIAEGALWSPPVIAAFRATPRHRFLDRVFVFERRRNRWRELLTREPQAKELKLLYADRALITHLRRPENQAIEVPISSSSQPSLMAQMLHDLDPRPGQRVLEIGAGTGYNAALLAHLVGPALVHTIDVDRSVLSEAWDHLRAWPDRQVDLHHADGRAGFSDHAPYERIMVTAATPDLEPAWLEQLTNEGRIVAPLALAPGLAFVVRGGVYGGVFRGGLTRAAYFMPLRAEHQANIEHDPIAPAGPGETVAAPWAGWFDRKRPRVRWGAFIQALVFFGYLRGLEIHYRASPKDGTTYGIRAASGDPAACWLGSRSWQINGPAGMELGLALYRDFLEAGGPWPTEFRLTASAASEPTSTAAPSFRRQGPRCRHLWELAEPRQRGGWL
jgi:protein-L-isoaspartate(D-aspartate) O-methyltransferase